MTWGYSALALRYCAGLASLADIARCVYTSVEAKKITGDAEIDIGADMAELMFLCQGLNTPALENAQKYKNTRGVTRIYAWWSIVYGTLTLITALELLNGWGSPDAGVEFDNGSRFDGTYDILTRAVPDYSKWSGAGADTYGKLNQKLSELVAQMSDADRQTEAIVRRQADQVQEAREGLAETRLSLVGLLLFVSVIAAQSFAANAVVNSANDMFGEAVRGADRTASVGTRVTAGNNAKGEFFREQGYSEQYASVAAAPAQFLEAWLPYIVLPPCIGAIAAVGIFVGRLIDDGCSNADDVEDPTGTYKTVVEAAAALLSGAAAMGVGLPAGLRSSISGITGLQTSPTPPYAAPSRVAPDRPAVQVARLAEDGSRHTNSDAHVTAQSLPLAATALPRRSTSAKRADTTEAASPNAAMPAGAGAGASADDVEVAETWGAAEPRQARGVPVEVVTVGPTPPRDPSRRHPRTTR